MKGRIIAIISLAIVLIGLVIVEHIYVEDTISYMKETTQEIKETVFNNENINLDWLIEKVNSLDKTWKQKENVLCLIVNHKDMEKVGEQIEKLKVLIPQNRKQEAEYEAELLVYYVDGYEHFIAVTFQNVF